MTRLAQGLGESLAHVPADPFAKDLVLTRSGGLQRWLTQQLSTHVGTTGHGDGICAGIHVATMAQFSTILRGKPSPWSSEALIAPIMTALNDLGSSKEFLQVRRHLADSESRPRRRASFTKMTAERFSSYATWNLDMVSCWNQGAFVLPDGSAISSEEIWQPLLWNHLCTLINSTPQEDLALIQAQAHSLRSDYNRVALFCPSILTPADESVLASLDSAGEILVFSAAPVDGCRDLTKISSKLAVHQQRSEEVLKRLCPPVEILATVSQDNPTLLKAIQQGLHTSVIPHTSFDDSIEIHTGYSDHLGEILTDQLIHLLNEDPSLEPREILVLVDQMADHYPSLSALLRPDMTEGSYCSHRIRGSVVHSEVAEDQELALLSSLFGLVQGRATAEDLMNLCGSKAVMARFGFQDLDLDRLNQLIQSSGIRWGINQEHRRIHSMESFPHNTWMTGLGRMVLGVALNEEDLTYQGTIFPRDVVDSDVVSLVESLGQIITQVRTYAGTWLKPAEPPEWASRFRTCLEALTPGTSSLARRVIGVFENQKSPEISLVEARTQLEEIWSTFAREPSFLNGNLGVAPLGSMSGVPHKVIILFGLDSNSFPTLPTIDGDNLVGFCPEEDPRLRDRQVFYDCLMSAQDKLIIIHCGYDPTTTHRAPEPAPVVDLLALAELCVPGCDARKALVHDHVPMVETRARISDHQALLEPRITRKESAAQVKIEDLCELFMNSAAYWLKRNAMILPSAITEPDPIPTAIPVDLSPLDSWAITNRMVRLLMAGNRGEEILNAELRRGYLPPGRPGITLGQNYLSQAQNTVHRARSFLSEPLSWPSFDLDSDETGNLVGQVGVRGQILLEVLAGKVNPRHKMAAWIKILALKVSFPDQHWRAVLVGRRTTVTVNAPTINEAHQHLEYLRKVGMRGVESPLPLPELPSAQLARYLARNFPINAYEIDENFIKQWNQDPSWPLIWPDYHQMQALGSLSDEENSTRTFESRFESLVYGVYVPMVKQEGVL